MSFTMRSHCCDKIIRQPALAPIHARIRNEERAEERRWVGRQPQASVRSMCEQTKTKNKKKQREEKMGGERSGQTRFRPWTSRHKQISNNNSNIIIIIITSYQRNK